MDKLTEQQGASQAAFPEEGQAALQQRLRKIELTVAGQCQHTDSICFVSMACTCAPKLSDSTWRSTEFQAG